MPMKTTTLLPILSFLLYNAATFAQTTTPVQAGSPYFSGLEYRLGSGDLIEVSVFGVDFSHLLRVDSSGSIEVPLLDPMTVAGLTAEELETKLELALDGRVFHGPRVSVTVKEYRPQPVFVNGAVNRPGQYQLLDKLPLIDVLTMAGGLTRSAAAELTIQRRLASPATASTANGKVVEVIPVNIKDFLKNGSAATTFLVQGGDIINVPEKPTAVYYVIGEVTSAGTFDLPREQPLRLSQALAQAGGPLKTAKVSDGMLVRYDEDGTRQELAVDFNKILKGEKEDFLMRPDDIIFIPGSKFKNIGYGILGILPSAVTSPVVR